jgi:SAM-dependent methyltransferase
MGLCPSDRVFDRLLPHELRTVSRQHWTPLAAAVRAAGWLAQVGARTVIDIGSGAGKFAVAAALSGNFRVTGVEQRLRLVEAARNLTRLLGAEERVEFVHATFGQTDLPVADAYYLYNPFGENLFGPEEQLDDDVELGSARYRRDVTAVERLMDDAPLGTHVLTYNGYGGTLPAGFQEVRVDHDLPNILRMWRKTRPISASLGPTSPGPSRPTKRR